MTTSYHVFDRSLVRHRRDRAAQIIAKPATQTIESDFLLSYVAEDFALRLQMILRNFPLVLDLGSHHGLLGRTLSGLPHIGSVISMDISPAMITHCEGLKLVGDEEFLPFAPATFDLVVSAFSLFSVNDLPGTLLQIRQILKPDGLCLIALPGGQTLHELREAFLCAETEIEGGASPHIAPFVDVRECGSLLQRAGLALPVTDSDILTVTYDNAFHLMKDLKAMGAGNALLSRKRTPLKRATLYRMAEIYQDKFGLETGKIPATFEIITLTGWSPHESQQKPLKPGSAKTRLADALGTKEFKTE